jgi:hypothetical protein
MLFSVLEMKADSPEETPLSLQQSGSTSNETQTVITQNLMPSQLLSEKNVEY